MNFYHGAYRGIVVTKLCNKRLLFLFPCPAKSAFPPTKTNGMLRKIFSFV